MPAAKEDVGLAAVFVERAQERTFPLLAASRVCGHDLLRAKLNDFLEADRDDLGTLFGKGTEPGKKVFAEAVDFAVEVEGAGVDVDFLGGGVFLRSVGISEKPSKRDTVRPTSSPSRSEPSRSQDRKDQRVYC